MSGMEVSELPDLGPLAVLLPVLDLLSRGFAVLSCLNFDG